MSLAEQVATRVGSLLERRTSRRGVIARAAVAGSAFAVAPIRYLVRPQPAWAVIGPGNCASGKCTDGYSAFCCEIEHGLNHCPANTYVAGWWKCTAYQGHGLCRDGCRRLGGRPCGDRAPRRCRHHRWRGLRAATVPSAVPDHL